MIIDFNEMDFRCHLVLTLAPDNHVLQSTTLC